MPPPTPPPTEEVRTEEVRATVAALEGGLAQLARPQALDHLDAWRRRLLDTGRADLRSLADGLAGLRELLDESVPDADALGRALARLGAQTSEAAQTVEDADLRRAVERLGHLLHHAGHALRGPQPPQE